MEQWLKHLTIPDVSASNRPLSRCGHLDFTPFKLIVTKLRLDEIIVWCHVCAMNVSIHSCYWKQGTFTNGDSVVKPFTIRLRTNYYFTTIVSQQCCWACRLILSYSLKSVLSLQENVLSPLIVTKVQQNEDHLQTRTSNILTCSVDIIMYASRDPTWISCVTSVSSCVIATSAYEVCCSEITEFTGMSAIVLTVELRIWLVKITEYILKRKLGHIL